MPKIGILAYGSLIDEPGEEIESLVVDRITDVETPFSIEFARTSGNRDGAPTLVPVSAGGSPVNATILVLKGEVSLDQARDLLWRRETGNVGSGRSYNPPENPNENTVLVDEFTDVAGIDVVISTRIGANIPEVSPDALARLAVQSAKTSAGTQRRDGISYLKNAKRNGFLTPIIRAYEDAILCITGAESLEEAWRICQSGAHNHAAAADEKVRRP
jgi:hypothetical protein